ncbi:UBX domain protein Ubx2 [Parahypoxylon ruwenzoriense]
MDEDVDQFMAITGVASEHVARGYLEISGGDPMQAIQLFFENPELQASFSAPPASTSASARPPASSSAANPSRGFAGREDAHGIIHIDSDDDENIPMTDNPYVMPDDDEDGHVAAIARNAQEEEDAAMARRLQEEMYSEHPGSADGVRAPIAQTTEMLAAPDPSWGIDDHREAAVMEQMRRRRIPQAGGVVNPFNQSSADWFDTEDDDVQPRISQAAQESSSTSRRLRDLFAPPTNLISRLPLDTARDIGREEKKWILVNLQKLDDFRCQVLNRDHWKNEGIVSLVREHFIFLQYTLDDPLAQSYTMFYFANLAHEDENNYPHVSIIDPRTGEQVKVWSGDSFPPPAEFHADLVEFLDRYSLAANSKNPVVKSKPKTKRVDIGRMTEEEMLEMALQNSLNEDGGASGSSVQDPDALTKSPDIGKGKGKATLETVGPTESSAQAPLSPPVPVGSAFAQISSTNPHIEPEHNPATTTRIQFRHAGGRIIRRFATTDRVQRIYEWLKAEPLEGKQGVQFELKVVPEGRDLIEELGKSIEEAGLKQGTVMIEFIEDS